MPTFRSRYREERTLVRGLEPLPGQARDTFKQNVRRLRQHFQQFNADVAGLCQWLIRFRPGSNRPIEGAQAFWEFFLEPGRFVSEADETQRDRLRLEAFEVAVGWQDGKRLASSSVSPVVQDSILAVGLLPLTHHARRLLGRLQYYARPHRMVVLKAAAEWIVAKYVRVYENRSRQGEEWQQEKTEWEKEHPELDEKVREAFNKIFRELQVQEKRARICTWERLQQNKDNCEYAGERFPWDGKWRSHSTLCRKYNKEFVGTLKGSQKGHFVNNAKQYLAHGDIRQLDPRAQKWFPKAWRDYLRCLGLREDTIRENYRGRLPHCVKFDADCEFNPHTEKCKRYKELVAQLPPASLEREPLYREWRRDYLSGPRKPDFRYPSGRSLSTPKIFGKHYFQADFDRSKLGLRLDDMGEGEFLAFGFKPWPRDYAPQPADTDITSVHIHFVGTRPRAGFRFRVLHKPSRFTCTQDEIDELRSRKFPRKAQDQKFLDAARNRLLESFNGDPTTQLKVLTVDLGTRGAYVALFRGKEFQQSQPLKVIKIDRLYDVPPRRDSRRQSGGGGKDPRRSTSKGLGREHVVRHLETVAEESRKISQKREAKGAIGLSRHDLRHLTHHIGWMIRDWARLNASQIIEIAEAREVDLLVFESLRGFRPPGYDKLDLEMKRRLAFFAYGRIRRKVVEKAVERGMRVVTVPYFYSSQVCNKCGKKQENTSKWRANKRKGYFRCESCTYKGNSDENAARVLGKVFWGDIVLPVGEK
ncbi:MAG: zinc ribbon domain-containing protein [Acidobacteriota bacterium]